MFKAALALGLLTAVALAVAFASVGDSAHPVSAGNGGMEAMSIDADPTGNTATTLGEQNECVEADAGTDVVVDVTALNIPAGNPMFGFSYQFTYDPNNLSITGLDNELLLASAPDSSLFDASDIIPDTDGTFEGGSIDIAPDPSSHESGSGVLSRVTVSVAADAPAGGYPLLLNTANSVHLDLNADPSIPDAHRSAQLAVGVTCESLGDLPTPTPPPAFAFGDIDCDGGPGARAVPLGAADVDAVDALQILRDVAGLGANQQPGCPAIGDQVGQVLWGDIDCDGDVDAVDALQILRHVAGIGANQGAGCPALP